MKNLFVSAILLPILLISCAPKKAGPVTCDLKRSDYTEVIRSTGTTQAVDNLAVNPPNEYYGILIVEWVLPEGSRVSKGDTVAILKCDEMSKILEDNIKELETLQADLKKLEADNEMNLAMLDARLKENQAGMSISQLDSIQMTFAPPVKKKLMALELEKAKVEEKKLQKKYKAERAIDESEIRQLKSRIIQADNKMQMMQDKVKALTIKAPGNGILIHNDNGGMMMMESDGSLTEFGGYPKIGGYIYPDMPLMTLPDLSRMQVQLDVQEVDYKRIENGQKVDITVDAAGGLHTTGLVKQKLLTGKNQYSSSGRSKLKFYQVIVSVDSLHERMPPGLSASCRILVSQVRDTVVVPSMAIFDKDSLKVVYVAEGEKFRPVPVKTGLYNSAQTIISSGLKGNETIALIEPPQNFIEKLKNQQ
jgi:macrolide-specific efflux system membrane fusion protein